MSGGILSHLLSLHRRGFLAGDAKRLRSLLKTLRMKLREIDLAAQELDAEVAKIEEVTNPSATVQSSVMARLQGLCHKLHESLRGVNVAEKKVQRQERKVEADNTVIEIIPVYLDGETHGGDIYVGNNSNHIDFSRSTAEHAKAKVKCDSLDVPLAFEIRVHGRDDGYTITAHGKNPLVIKEGNKEEHDLAHKNSWTFKDNILIGYRQNNQVIWFKPSLLKRNEHDHRPRHSHKGPMISGEQFRRRA